MRRNREKTRKLRSAVRWRWLGLLANLALALGFLYAADRFLSSLTKPELVIQLVASDSGKRLAVHVVNTSGHDVMLALDTVHSFMVPVPDTTHEYVIHLRSMAEPGSLAGGAVVLPQDKEIVLADVSRHLRVAPPGTLLLLTAVFIADTVRRNDGSAWNCFVRSAPLAIHSL